MRAAIYARISQDRFGAGLGVARQREDCERLIADRGWELVGVYEANDISAYSGKLRPGYRRLLEDIEAGQLNACPIKCALDSHAAAVDPRRESRCHRRGFVQQAEGNFRVRSGAISTPDPTHADTQHSPVFAGQREARRYDHERPSSGGHPGRPGT